MKYGIARSAALFAFAYASFGSVAWASGGNADFHLGGSRECAWVGCTNTEYTYGVALGYDADIGKHAFIGAQAMLDSIKSEGDSYANYGVVARIGARSEDNSRIYALGGYAAQNFGFDAGTWAGWRLGAGYEQTVGKDVFIKIEYRYSEYSKYGESINQNTGIIGFGTRF